MYKYCISGSRIQSYEMVKLVNKALACGFGSRLTQNNDLNISLHSLALGIIRTEEGLISSDSG